MIEKIIETAGKTWQFLGQNGETEINALVKRLKEKNDVVLQSLGWLAREDKISYANRDNKTFVSLIDTETRIFKSITRNIQQPVQPKKEMKPCKLPASTDRQTGTAGHMTRQSRKAAKAV